MAINCMLQCGSERLPIVSSTKDQGSYSIAFKRAILNQNDSHNPIAINVTFSWSLTWVLGEYNFQTRNIRQHILNICLFYLFLSIKSLFNERKLYHHLSLNKYTDTNILLVLMETPLAAIMPNTYVYMIYIGSYAGYGYFLLCDGFSCCRLILKFTHILQACLTGNSTI